VGARAGIFGPVLSVTPFDTEEEAATMALAGLAAGIWTTNLSRAMRMSREIQAGTVWINTYRASSTMAPFGGFKEWGSARSAGQWRSTNICRPRERDDRLLRRGA
jgi:acyl-CoA reductase-like NAD-dependent aldehyde dehydrogenase